MLYIHCFEVKKVQTLKTIKSEINLIDTDKLIFTEPIMIKYWYFHMCLSQLLLLEVFEVEVKDLIEEIARHLKTKND